MKNRVLQGGCTLFLFLASLRSHLPQHAFFEAHWSNTYLIQGHVWKVRSDIIALTALLRDRIRCLITIERQQLLKRHFTALNKRTVVSWEMGHSFRWTWEMLSSWGKAGTASKGRISWTAYDTYGTHCCKMLWWSLNLDSFKERLSKHMEKRSNDGCRPAMFNRFKPKIIELATILGKLKVKLGGLIPV